MPYSKYLKPGQKVLLRAHRPAAAKERFEALTAFVRELGPDHLDLTLPYRAREGEEYPFAPGMSFELLSDALGLGIRLTGAYQSSRGTSLIRLHHNRDLELIRRRYFKRRNATVGLRYTKGQGKLRTFRAQWEKNIRIIGSGKALDSLPNFPRCRVNLSGGGIRFALKMPAAIADLCLLLLELPDGKPPICALAEVVWLDEKEVEGRHLAGMQFLNILETDRKRIDQFIQSGDPEFEEDKLATA